jgi:hypothetical protein
VPLDPTNAIERSILKNTPAEEQDRREWVEIRRWAGAIAETLTAGATPDARDACAGDAAPAP